MSAQTVGPKRILVTGASGMLGATLVPRLVALGHQVIRHGFTSQGDVTADLTCWADAKRALDRASPETIINLAANTDVEACERNPKDAYHINVRLVENLARWIAEKTTAPRLIQVSTDHVYDGAGPHSECSAEPANYYALSKYAGELAALRCADATVIRTNFFGVSRAASRKSFSDWLVSGLNGAGLVTVYEDVMFSPLTMDHLADYVDLIARDPRPGIFNIGSRDGQSKADFAFRLAEVLKLSTDKLVRTPYRSQSAVPRPRDMRMDCSLFESAYGLHLPTLRSEIESLQAGHDGQRTKHRN